LGRGTRSREVPLTPTLSDRLRAEIRRRRPQAGPFPDDRPLAELGLDSAELLDLVATLEDELDIAVPLDDVVRLRTFADLVADVARRVEQRS
jgi:acyl carrier protein